MCVKSTFVMFRCHKKNNMVHLHTPYTNHKGSWLADLKSYLLRNVNHTLKIFFYFSLCDTFGNLKSLSSMVSWCGLGMQDYYLRPLSTEQATIYSLSWSVII